MSSYRGVPPITCFGVRYIEKYNYQKFRNWVDGGNDPSTYQELRPISARMVFAPTTRNDASRGAIDHLLDNGTVYVDWIGNHMQHITYTPAQLACAVALCNGVAEDLKPYRQSRLSIAHLLAFSRFVERDTAPSAIPHTPFIALFDVAAYTYWLGKRVTVGGFVRQRPQEHGWYTTFVSNVQMEQSVAKVAAKNASYRRTKNAAMWSRTINANVQCAMTVVPVTDQAQTKSKIRISLRCAHSPKTPSHLCLAIRGYGRATITHCPRFAALAKRMKALLERFVAAPTVDGTKNVTLFAVAAFLTIQNTASF